MSTPPCPDDIRVRLSAYLDGDVVDPEKSAIEAALATCAACREELEKLRGTLGKLSGLKAGAPPSFLADIKQQIHTRSRGRFFAKPARLFGRIPFEWLSFAMIVVMLLYYIVVLQSSPTDAVPAP